MSTESRTREVGEELSTEPCSVNMLKITCVKSKIVSARGLRQSRLVLGFLGCSQGSAEQDEVPLPSREQPSLL